MVTPIYSDEQLLKLLEKDIEKGAAALMEQYSGILWSVCARRLQDPEDIKECVNGSFADFCLHYEKYDPEKGSLRTYLCGIADLKALEAYRKIASRLRAREAYEQTYADAYALPTESSELEAALEQLEPEDAKIIRMKYYEGMTYLEIAKALGLNPETVKKRGQRSLKKLKFILIGLIIALVLAGCAYIVHRYFRFAEGFGVFTDADTPVYQLSYASDPLTVNDATLFVKNAVYRDGELNIVLGYMTGDFYRVTQFSKATGKEYVVDFSDSLEHIYIPRVVYISDEAGYISTEEEIPTDGMDKEIIYRCTGEAVPAEDGTIQCKLELLFDQDHVERTRNVGSSEHTFYSQEFDKSTLTFQITLTELEESENLTDFGSVESLGGTTLLVRPGYEEEGWVKIPFYTMSLPEGMELSPLLCAYYVQFPGYERLSPSEIYLEGADGSRYPLIRVEKHYLVDSNEQRMWFRDVPPGEYTLHLPRVCYVGTNSEYTILSLPQEDGQRLSCDKTVAFAAGGTFHIRGVTLQREQVEVGFNFQEWNQEGAPEAEVRSLQDNFIYTLDYEIAGEGEYPLVGMNMTGEYFHRVDGALMLLSIDSFISEQSQLGDPFGTISYNAYAPLHIPAPELVQLRLLNPVYMDNQAYSLPVTVR